MMQPIAFHDHLAGNRLFHALFLTVFEKPVKLLDLFPDFRFHRF
jgi:hypothetical protein